MPERLIVIGGGGAGTATATIAKRLNPDLKVTLFTEFPDIAYSPCGIPFVHGREIDNFESLFLSTVERYVEDGLDMRMASTSSRSARAGCGRSPTCRAPTCLGCTTSRTSARRWSSTSSSTT
jgi:flavin-dependent dehydrogenase